MYRSDQFECNCITDLGLNIQPTISLQPLSLFLDGVDRPAHTLSMINGFSVYIHGHVSRWHWWKIGTMEFDETNDDVNVLIFLHDWK